MTNLSTEKRKISANISSILCINSKEEQENYLQITLVEAVYGDLFPTMHAIFMTNLTGRGNKQRNNYKFSELNPTNTTVSIINPSDFYKLATLIAMQPAGSLSRQVERVLVGNEEVIRYCGVNLRKFNDTKVLNSLLGCRLVRSDTKSGGIYLDYGSAASATLVYQVNISKP